LSVSTDMKVSVIIPTYNRADYLGAAIDSVLEQTLPGVEAIVVDDGSTDDTEELAKRYAGRIQYVRTEHVGYAHARNVGIRAARGEYIAFLDSDDLYYPYKLELQARVLDDHPDVAMVCSECSSFGDRGSGERFHLRTYHDSGYRSQGYDDIFDTSMPLDRAGLLPAGDAGSDLAGRRVYFGNIFGPYLRNLVVFVNSIMVRRRTFLEFGDLNESLRYFIELDFLLRVCRRNRVAFIDVPTYKLRYHPGQISTTANADGTYVALQKQHCLLRTVRHHIRRNPDYYELHREDLDLLLARLHRAVAIPLISCELNGSRARTGYTGRARKHLARAWTLGRREPVLWTISLLPAAARRLAFAVLARLGSRSRRRRGPTQPAGADLAPAQGPVTGTARLRSGVPR
jgi:glycosyltransferase involved in cell wall biosynthesis